jgi:hypothetical protein
MINLPSLYFLQKDVKSLRLLILRKPQNSDALKNLPNLLD